MDTDINVSDLKQCYDLFAPEGRVVSAERLAHILRSLNLKPTTDEARKYFATYRKADGVIEYEDFVRIVNGHLKLEDPENEIIEAFKMLDPKNTGTIDEDELRRILLQTGEKLSDSQVDKMLKSAKRPKQGKVQYVDFVRQMLRETNY